MSASCNWFWGVRYVIGIVLFIGIVPTVPSGSGGGSGSGSGNVFTNIFMQIPTFFRQTKCSKHYQWKTNDSRNDTQCQEGTQAVIKDKIMFINSKIQK